MKVTILQDTKAIGKTRSGTRHPIKGLIKTKTFNTAPEFSSIIAGLTEHECLTIGLFENNYNYVPSTDTLKLSRPRHITRTASNASPGHIFLIDCDFDKFHHLKGHDLHKFLSKYLPDIFDGASYVTTSSTSYYLKGKHAFHQYYLFKHPTDFKQLSILVDKLFKHHNMLTYSVAKNFSRTYVKTPIDTKLHELQMPVFEYTNLRHQYMTDEDTDEDIDIDITVSDGIIIDAQILQLPSIDTSDALINEEHVRQIGEQERKINLINYLKDNGSANPTQDSESLERREMPADMSLVAKTSKGENITTSLVGEVLKLVSNSVNPNELYMAIGEPEYAAHQTAKLMYTDPYDLKNYRMVDQAHGGTVYQVVWDFESLNSVLEQAKAVTPLKFIKLIQATNNIDAQEAQLLGQLHARKGVITAAKLAVAINSSAPQITSPESINELSTYDQATMLAALEAKKVNLTSAEQGMIAKGVNLGKLFNSDNVYELQGLVYGHGKDEVLIRPGPMNDFNIASRAKIVKQLAPLYPTTHISPYADEATLDALIQKYTATNKVESISYKASMHGESLYFGSGLVDITYQQQRPTFARVPTAIKQTLDTMSSSTLSEFEDIYMTKSLGTIWATLSDLAYIKKMDPTLKKDFVHLHLPTDAGKTFNMDAANLITPYERTNLDQFFEQAAKLNPISIAKSSFLFHDEVKGFHHQWNELGAYYSLKQAYATDSILTQLPLKVMASAENVMTKGTKQQLNRLMVMNYEHIKSFKELKIRPEHESFMTAVMYKTIYEAFTDSYNKYANIPEQRALQIAKTSAAGYAVSLSPDDMVVTGDYITEAVKSFLLQELVDMGSNTVVPSAAVVDYNNKINAYVKAYAVKDGYLHVSFKKMSLSNFIEFVLSETTSKLEARSMNYEALSMTWEEIGCYKLNKPATLGGTSGFYGQCIKLEIERI